MSLKNKHSTLHIRVTESKKQKLEEYIEEAPEVDSISGLIRMSVEKEMSGMYDGMGIEMDGLYDMLDNIRKRQEQILDSVDTDDNDAEINADDILTAMEEK